MWEYRASLVRIIDGDTIVALIDQGFGGRQEESLRLTGVSAPERSQVGHNEVMIFVENWFLNAVSHQINRWPLIVRTQPNTAIDPNERRTLTRYLAAVYDSVSMNCLNDSVNMFLLEHPEWPTGL